MIFFKGEQYGLDCLPVILDSTVYTPFCRAISAIEDRTGTEIRAPSFVFAPIDFGEQVQQQAIAVLKHE
jgi:hypothetical protein